MKRDVRKIIIVLCAVFFAMLLTGCLSVNADELYSLPRVSDEYLRLQSHISMVISQGAEFAPPTGGPNRQAVQLRDLSGSGVNEVIAFFSTPGDSTLKIYIYHMYDGDYVVADIIEGVGTAIESVRYVDMDGDGIAEIVVGWQMGPALKYMSIYSIKDFHSVSLAGGVEYSEMAIYDLTGDGTDDVVVLRLPTQESVAYAEVFSLMPDGEVVSTDARLSSGIDTISRVLTGRLIDSTPAVFVDSEGTFENGSLVTDILAFNNNGFSNVSIRAQSGVSEETVRTRMYSSDINKDGIIKVPMLRLLKAQSETEYFAIDWYAVNSRGYTSLLLTTYHNNFDEWFLILPFDWRGRVSVRREDAVPGERTIIFSYIAGDEGPYEDFVKIFKLSGDTAIERARLPGRRMLMTEGTAVYAFELIAEPNSYGLTFDENLIRDHFRLIYSDWLSGVSS